MIEWTESARQVLNEYCARSKNVLAGSGADADEVGEDLKRHVEEEARAAHLSIVTEVDVRRILARVGEPGPAAVEPVKPQPSRSLEPASPTEKRRPGYMLLLLGVILPLGTLLFELATGISAGLLFDPVPNWFHVVAVAFVPAVNFWMWRAGRARDTRSARLLGWLNAIALGICIYYSLLYLVFTPFAAIGVLYFGAGLIPLTPHFAVIATPLIRAAYKGRIGQAKLSGGWGVLIGFALLVLLQMPTAITYYGLARASSSDAATRTNGIRILRSFGDEELLLRACYGFLGRELDFDLVQKIATGDKSISAEDARVTYYRVTGQPFNSVRPPALYTRRGVWTALDEEFTWDDALGSESVAGRVKGGCRCSVREWMLLPSLRLPWCIASGRWSSRMFPGSNAKRVRRSRCRRAQSSHG